MRRGAVMVIVVAFAIASGTGVAWAASETKLVSANRRGASGTLMSSNPSMSADGHYVAFESGAKDLVQRDGNSYSDIFVRNLALGSTVRASVDVAGGDANAGSVAASISGDGRYVAFMSSATDLTPGGGNGYPDIYVRDLVDEMMVRASVDTQGGDPERGSFGPAISADGRYVAFVSDGSDFVDADGNDSYDVFVRDLVAGVTVRASVDMSGGDANGFSDEPSISADGRYVAFRSNATDLVLNDGSSGPDVFVRDLALGITVQATVDTQAGDADNDSFHPSISADGRHVAFASRASDLIVGDGNSAIDVFVRDLTGGTTTRASVDLQGGDPDFLSADPTISADGRYVAFYSGAQDLVRHDANGNDIFVRDLIEEVTVRVSVDAEGGDANAGNVDPSISGDGRSVAFQSGATDLVHGDGNGWDDVFCAKWR